MIERDEIKEQVRRSTDIVDVIGEFVRLQKRGKNYLGLCPFHDEKTPSFTVFPENGIYKCFGCSAAGDVFSFMTKYHGMSFPEALERLANKAGIALPKSQKQGSKPNPQMDKKEAAHKALYSAMEFFTYMLSTEKGKGALEYFVNRKFSDELMKRFGLGYSPDSWDMTSRELIKKGYSEQTLIDAGLIVKKEDGKFYDRFRARPMFPIRDILGRVIGFGARKIKEDDPQGKYINSPQSLVYDKSQSLYGLFEGKNALRNKEFAILVEGYADVLSLHQAGFENAIASSGTALTTEQLDIIARYCKKLYLVYDADSAGQKATDRALEPAIERQFELFIVQLPSGEDPDSLVRTQGGQVFQEYLNKAVPFINFKIDRFKASGMLDSPAGKADAARELIHLIAKIPDRLKHDFYIAHLSALLNISEMQLHNIYAEKIEFEKKIKEDKKSYSQPTNVNDNAEYEVNVSEPKESLETQVERILSSIFPEEILLIYLSLTGKPALKLIFKTFKLTSSNFLTIEGRRLFSIIIDLHENSTDLLRDILLAEKVDESDKKIFSEINSKYGPTSKHWHEFGAVVPEMNIDRNIREALDRLKLKYIDRRLQELNSTNSPNLPFEEQIAIIDEIKKLSSRRSELLNNFNKVVKMI